MASIVKTENYSYKIFFMVSITLFFIQLMFLALGIIISVVVPKIKTVLPISLGTVFTLFIIGMFAATTGDDFLRFITPFKYFETSYILKNGSYELSFILIGLGFIIATISASYVLYSKKDVHAV